jgi:ABC-type multidrug transport system ATPase subunit
MKQRVALARAWLPGPEVLLLDEPFGALDAQTRLMMQELLREAWLTTGTTLLFVTHDVEEALFLADRILVMSAKPGKIVEEIVLPFGRERDIETLAEHPRTAKSSSTFSPRAPGGETSFRLTPVPGVGNESTVITEVEAMSTSELRDRLEESIHQHRDEYVAIAKDIHAHPETGNNEYYANGC